VTIATVYNSTMNVLLFPSPWLELLTNEVKDFTSKSYNPYMYPEGGSYG